MWGQLGWTFFTVFLETHPGCIVMNYGMCRINKGARLKRADICPNLYFFTFTIFHRNFFYTSLKRIFRVIVEHVISSGHIHVLSNHCRSYPSHFSGSYPFQIIAGHIHIHVFTLASLQEFLATKFSWNIHNSSSIGTRETIATIWWIIIFRQSKYLANSRSSKVHNGAEISG